MVFIRIWVLYERIWSAYGKFEFLHRTWWFSSEPECSVREFELPKEYPIFLIEPDGSSYFKSLIVIPPSENFFVIIKKLTISSVYNIDVPFLLIFHSPDGLPEYFFLIPLVWLHLLSECTPALIHWFFTKLNVVWRQIKYNWWLASLSSSNQSLKGSFFSLTNCWTSGIHHEVINCPPKTYPMFFVPHASVAEASGPSLKSSHSAPISDSIACRPWNLMIKTLVNLILNSSDLNSSHFIRFIRDGLDRGEFVHRISESQLPDGDQLAALLPSSQGRPLLNFWDLRRHSWNQ